MMKVSRTSPSTRNMWLSWLYASGIETSLAERRHYLTGQPWLRRITRDAAPPERPRSAIRPRCADGLPSRREYGRARYGRSASGGQEKKDKHLVRLAVRADDRLQPS